VRLSVENPVLCTLVCAVLFWSCWVVVFSASQLTKVFTFEGNFSVVSSYVQCEQPYNNRCRRHYILRNRDSGVEDDIVPFAGQFPVDPMPDDMHIRKTKNSFIYEIDGSEERWPSLVFNLVIFSCGLVAILLWFYLGAIPFLKRSIDFDD